MVLSFLLLDQVQLQGVRWLELSSYLNLIFDSHGVIIKIYCGLELVIVNWLFSSISVKFEDGELLVGDVDLDCGRMLLV